MTTPDEFNLLDEADKAKAIDQAVFLADREENGLIVWLYSLPYFYAEVFYDPAVFKTLHFKAFDNISQLTPYLAHIKFNPR